MLKKRKTVLTDQNLMCTPHFHGRGIKYTQLEKCDHQGCKMVATDGQFPS